MYAWTALAFQMEYSILLAAKLRQLQLSCQATNTGRNMGIQFLFDDGLPFKTNAADS